MFANLFYKGQYKMLFAQAEAWWKKSTDFIHKLLISVKCSHKIHEKLKYAKIYYLLIYQLIIKLSTINLSIN